MLGGSKAGKNHETLCLKYLHRVGNETSWAPKGPESPKAIEEDLNASSANANITWKDGYIPVPETRSSMLNPDLSTLVFELNFEHTQTRPGRRTANE